MKYLLIILILMVLVFGFVWLKKNEVPAANTTSGNSGLGGFLVNNQTNSGGYDGSGILGGLFDFSGLFNASEANKNTLNIV